MLHLLGFLISWRIRPEAIELWNAVLNEQYDEAIALVRARADVNELRPDDEKKETLLHYLAKRTDYKKSIKLALLILDYKANPNALDTIGNSPLRYAVQGNSIELVEKLLKCGAKLDVSNRFDIDVLFDAAMNSQRRELLLLLLKYDVADEDTRNRRGITALKYLIRLFYDNDIAIRALLDLGLPVNQTEQSCGWTPLHYATVMYNVHLVNILLEYGADVNKKSQGGVTVLSAASARKKSVITKILFEGGATYECNTNDGQYPIHYACFYKSVDNIRFLLHRGASLNVTCKLGKTPFFWMEIDDEIQESHRVVLKYFAIMIEKGITVNKSDLEIIYKDIDLQEYYEQCLIEVQRLKKTHVIGCITYFNIIDRTLKELSFLARNEKLVKSFDTSEVEHLFPLFFVEMDIALKNAVECRNKLKLREIAVCESLCGLIPELVLEKIIFYFYINEVR